MRLAALCSSSGSSAKKKKKLSVPIASTRSSQIPQWNMRTPVRRTGSIPDTISLTFSQRFLSFASSTRMSGNFKFSRSLSLLSWLTYEWLTTSFFSSAANVTSRRTTPWWYPSMVLGSSRYGSNTLSAGKYFAWYSCLRKASSTIRASASLHRSFKSPSTSSSCQGSWSIMIRGRHSRSPFNAFHRARRSSFTGANATSRYSFASCVRIC